MRLNEGFVVGGRYRIESLVANGSKFRVYAAWSGQDGPGRVAVKVARHEGVTSLAGLEAGRARVESEWWSLRRLHEHATSAAPLPIELVQMYPGDPEVRRVALLDRSAVRSEPYLVSEFADGLPLGVALQHEDLDEERALLLALRVVLLIKSGLSVGLLLDDFTTSNFVVDHAGENLTVVDLTGAVDLTTKAGAPAPDPSLIHVPTGFGRLLVSLLGTKGAPEWSTDEAARERWERLLDRRRIPREFHSVALGALGYHDAFDATIERVEERIRALVRAPRPRVFGRGPSAHDAPYLIADGERIADRFEVIGPLGQGGRGFVYRARDLRSDVEVLVKANKYVYDSGSAFALELPTRRLELEHEFRILKEFAADTGMLPQPVALVRDRGRGAWFDLAPDLAVDEPFLVMEYLKGIPLLDLLPEPYDAYEGASKPGNRLKPSFVLRLVAQVAELLETFHAHGFLYQDLKPENILYDPNAENVYLVDFAGACPRAPDGTLDKSSVAFGVQTHGFAAPEFAELWERSDHRFDIYSLGATAYHLLTGVNPERVALEQGSEYPELSRAVLQSLHPAAATLVGKCLAPLEYRLPSAGAVRRVAEAARLQLSRSRPLDVRELGVAYTSTGVALSWTLPPDPRLSRIRVTRSVGDDSAVIYDGEPCVSMADDSPAVADRTYVVETGLSRRGSQRHSRGREVRAEAWPAPVSFSVQPYFGGNRLRVVPAPHASSVEVRFGEEGPPTSTEEGELFALESGEVTLHEGHIGRLVHYAAFARYGEAASAPRYGSAAALPPLPELGEVFVRQRSEGVVVTWSRAADGVLVEVVEDAGTRELIPDEGASSVTDREAAPDARLRYRLRVRMGQVTSDPLAELEIRRWPIAPEIDVVPGVERVEVSATKIHERISGFDVHVLVPGEDPRPLFFGVDALPARVDVPPDVRADLLIRCRVDGEQEGPAVAGRVVLPSAEASLRLEVSDKILPVRLRAHLPPVATGWSDPISIVVERAGELVFEWTGLAEDLEADADGPFAIVEDDDLEPGQQCEWRLRVGTRLGDTVGEAIARARVLELLAVPECEPVLAGFELALAHGVQVADALVTRQGDELKLEAVRLPCSVELRPGEAVEVRWRRAVDGEPMPWSPPALLRTLERPPHPVGVRVERPGGVPVLHWEALAGEGYRYRVEDADTGRQIFFGFGTAAPDLAVVPARRYRLVSVRDGLDSEPVEAPGFAAGGEGAATTSALVQVQRRRRGLRPSTDRLQQCVRVSRRLAVAEISGPPRKRMVAVIADEGNEALDRIMRDMRRPDWREVDGLESVVTAISRRVLVPWRGPDRPVRILEAELGTRRPDWRIIASCVEPTRGGVVGALFNEPMVVELTARRSYRLGPDDVLVAFGADGSVVEVPLATAAGQPLEELDRAGASIAVGDRLAGVEGLGLRIGDVPAILVGLPDHGEAATAVAHVWDSAALGFPLWIGLELERAWSAPIASAHLAQPGVFHFLKAGRHVEIQVGCSVLSPRGRARLQVELRCDSGRHRRGFGVTLDRPESHPRVARRLLSWLDRAIKPERQWWVA